MTFLKLSTVHFLAISLALNAVLLGLVCYLFQMNEPRPLAVATPAPVTASRVETQVASENAERPPAPVSSSNVPIVSYSTPVQAPVVPSTQPQGSWSVPSEFSAPAPAVNTEPAPSEPTVIHDANAPGNSFKFKNMVVAVEGESDDVEGTGPGLLVSVSGAASQGAVVLPTGANNPPTSSSPSATQTRQQTSEDQTVATDNGGTTNNGQSRGRSGSPFTYEEELFRTKWGWAAFNAAQAAAAQAQAAASPAQ